MWRSTESRFEESRFSAGQWNNPELLIPEGHGMFLNHPGETPGKLLIAGVTPSRVPISIPAKGCVLVGRRSCGPDGGSSPFQEVFGKEPPQGAVTYLWEGAAYRPNAFLDLDWEIPGDWLPRGQAFWYCADGTSPPGPARTDCIVLRCPADVRVVTCAPEVPVVFDASAISNCPGLPPPSTTCVPPSGSNFPVGTNTVTCTATDPSTGSSISCQFQVVVVRDLTPPVIQCPPNIVTNSPSPGGVVVHYTATATDALDPNPVLVCVPPSGSIFQPGVTTVTCTANDRCGNRVTCSFTVTVEIPKCVRFPKPPVLKFVKYEGTNACYVLILSLQNFSGVPVRYLVLDGITDCVNIVPPVVDLTLPAYGGSVLPPSGTRNVVVSLKIGKGCPRPHEFWLSLHDTAFRNCCATRVRIPLAASLTLNGATAGVVYTQLRRFNLRISGDLVRPPVVVRLYANEDLVGSDAVPPYEFEYLFSARSHVGLSAEVEYDNGELEWVDPIELRAPARAIPVPVARLDSGANGLSLRFHAEPGITYVLESSTKLGRDENTWQEQATIVGDDKTREIFLPIEPGPGRFFRIRAMP